MKSIRKRHPKRERSVSVEQIQIRHRIGHRKQDQRLIYIGDLRTDEKVLPRQDLLYNTGKISVYRSGTVVDTYSISFKRVVG